MNNISVPRKQVVICALTDAPLRMHREDGTYRIDPHDALERMLNGHDTYELTTVTVEFTGSVDVNDPEISARLSPSPQ